MIYLSKEEFDAAMIKVMEKLELIKKNTDFLIESFDKVMKKKVK